MRPCSLSTSAPSAALTLPIGDVRRAVAGARLEIDHRHDDLEFNLVVQGSGSYVLDGGSHVLKPGTLIWLMPGQLHRLSRAPRLEMWVITLRAPLLNAATLAALANQPTRQLPGEDLLDIDRLLSQIAQDSDEPEVYNAGIAYAVQRAVRASLRAPPTMSREIHPAVARALLKLRDTGAEVSLPELAEAAGVTVTYLSRLLTEHTGRSFVDWRNRVRLDRFIAAYRPGSNLLDGALDAGFGSYARFSAVFHGLIRCSPSEWTRRIDENATGGMVPSPRPAMATTAVKVIDWGLASAAMASQRHGWLALVPWVDEVLGAVTRGGLVNRIVLVDRPVGALPAGQVFDGQLAPALRDRLVAGLRQQQPALADTLARLLELHDVAAFCARVFDAYGMSSIRLDDMLTGYLIALWIAAHGAPDPSLPQVRALHAQVQRAFGGRMSGLEIDAQRHLHAALQCHFTIVIQAMQAARANAEPRVLEQVSEGARVAARRAFADDLALFDLGSDGLVVKVQ